MEDDTLRPGPEADSTPANGEGEQQAKKRRAPRRTAAEGAAPADEAPRPRTRRKKADAEPADAGAGAAAEGEPAERPRRPRSPRPAGPVASSDAPAPPEIDDAQAPADTQAPADAEAPADAQEPAPAPAPRPQPHRMVIDLTSPGGGDRPRPPVDEPPVPVWPRDTADPVGREEQPQWNPPQQRSEEEGGRRKRKRDRRKKDRYREGAPAEGNGAQPHAQPSAPQAAQNGQQGPAEPFEGMLELIGDKKFGFIRSVTTSLQKGDNDPFLPPPLIQKYNLRDGVTLKGTISRGRKGAWQVSKIDEVMGMNPDDWKDVVDFDAGMVIYPDEKLSLITGPSDVTMRVIDLVAPIGKGQRSLIVAPPRAGKTVILKQLAAGIEQNHPEVELIALLIDERPEEVTDFRRNTQARVFASSNDFGEDNHVRVATMAFEYARRLVELGRDVVILLDSLTRLGRTFNLWGGNSGRTMSGGLDARALLIPRKIFGAARNIEGGGSLTIIATALIETGSRMDDVIFEEFKGTGNAEIVLDRELADKRIYPAINIRKSGTRNEERLMPEEQIRQRHMLFRVLNARHPVEAMQALVRQIQLSPTNVHLLNELIPEQY